MTPPAGRNALLVHIAGLDWRVLHPLIDAGLMPHLEGLIEQGAMGSMAAPPPLVPPLLWNTLVTGQPAAVHGIVAARTASGEPVVDADRRSPAVWQMAAGQGLDSCVVGGWAVQDGGASGALCVAGQYGAPQIANTAAALEACVSDPSARPALADAWMRPEEVEVDTIAWFVPDWQQVDQDSDPRLAQIGDALALTLSRHAAITWLLAHRAPHLAVVDYPLMTLLAPLFLPDHRSPDAAAGSQAPLFGWVITRACQLLDMLLGRLLELVDDRTNVLLCASHGLRRPGPDEDPRAWQARGQEGQASGQGVIVAAGPDCRPDALVHGASLYDVVPTVLQLLGLPVGGDMPGRVLVEMLVAPAPVRFVDHWRAVAAAATGSALLDERTQLQRLLRGLGKPLAGGARHDTPSPAVEWDWNLARACRQGGWPTQALPLLEALSEQYPERLDFLVELIDCQLQLGLIQEAREGAEILQDHQPDAPLVELILARIAHTAGQYAQSLAHVEQAIRLGGDGPPLQGQLGQAYLQLHRWDDALAAFARAPDDSADARRGRARALLGLRRFEAAAEAALDAVRQDYQQPQSHFLLGIALLRRGMLAEAGVSLLNCVRLAPHWTPPHAHLLRIKRRLGYPDAQLQPHRQALARGRDAERQLSRLHAEATARQQQREHARQVSRARQPDPAITAAPAVHRRAPSAMTLTLVTGLPRAGGGAVMAMLQAGGMALLRDAADGFGWSGLDVLRERPELLVQARDRALYVPSTLLTCLPRLHHYRVVYVDRPIGELVISQQRGSGSAAQAGSDLPHYEQGRLLLKHRNGVLWALRAAPHVSLIELSLPRLMDVAEGEVDRLRRFLGEERLPDRAAMLRSLDPARCRVRMGGPLVPRVLHDPLFAQDAVGAED